jgi:hypothetical protein
MHALGRRIEPSPGASQAQLTVDEPLPHQHAVLPNLQALVCAHLGDEAGQRLEARVEAWPGARWDGQDEAGARGRGAGRARWRRSRGGGARSRAPPKALHTWSPWCDAWMTVASAGTVRHIVFR